MHQLIEGSKKGGGAKFEVLVVVLIYIHVLSDFPWNLDIYFLKEVSKSVYRDGGGGQGCEFVEY